MRKVLTEPQTEGMFEDETWLVHQPPEGVWNPRLVGSWSAVGKPMLVPRSYQKGKERWVMYLELNLKKRRVSWEETEGVSQDWTWQFLERRLRGYEALGSRWLVVFWDNATWHRGRLMERVRCWNRESRGREGIRLVPVALPKRSPWLNPLEAIIGQGKRRVLGNRSFDGVDEQKASLRRHFHLRNEEQASQLPKLNITPWIQH